MLESFFFSIALSNLSITAARYIYLILPVLLDCWTDWRMTCVQPSIYAGGSVRSERKKLKKTKILHPPSQKNKHNKVTSISPVPARLCVIRAGQV